MQGKAVLVQLFALCFHVTALIEAARNGQERKKERTTGQELDRRPTPQLLMTAFNSPMSQFCPVQPGTHSQKYPPMRLRHELALRQGLLSHSLASREGEKGLVADACAVGRRQVVERAQRAYRSNMSSPSTVRDNDTCSH